METYEPKLELFRDALNASLRGYEQVIDSEISFGEFSDFRVTPDKPNYARTVVPVRYRGSEVGEMYAITFLSGDGTGDENTYKIGDVIIPDEFRFKEKQERVIPRSKEGIALEAFFPLFSTNHRGHVIPFAACLEELTLNDHNEIECAWNLGSKQQRYLIQLDSDPESMPRISLTTGTRQYWERFGDPHAIYNPVKVPHSQTVGFLGISDENNPLYKVISDRLLIH
mgnify:CR=1 FL=1